MMLILLWYVKVTKIGQKYFVKILKIFDEHHMWHQNWHYMWTSLCQSILVNLQLFDFFVIWHQSFSEYLFIFFMNLIHSQAVWLFDT